MTSTTGKLSIIVFSNYPALAKPLLDELCVAHTVLRVVSVSPDIAELCKSRGIPFTSFPKCPEGAMTARICKEDPGYRLMVDDVYSTIRDCRPEVCTSHACMAYSTGIDMGTLARNNHMHAVLMQCIDTFMPEGMGKRERIQGTSWAPSGRPCVSGNAMTGGEMHASMCCSVITT